MTDFFDFLSSHSFRAFSTILLTLSSKQDMARIQYVCEEPETNNKNIVSSSYFYPSSEKATRRPKIVAALKFYLQQHK
jgi:hypothetical protein